MSVFPLNDVWIDANFKEGQLDQLRIGQSVDLYVDAYPGRVFPGAWPDLARARARRCRFCRRRTRRAISSKSCSGCRCASS